MDDNLAQRYLALFLAYNVGGRGDLEALKLRLLQSTPDFLRPDAALLLLSLYDQMIFRPFTGPILSPTREWMNIPPIGLDLASFNQRVTNSLDMISGFRRTASCKNASATCSSVQ